MWPGEQCHITVFAQGLTLHLPTVPGAVFLHVLQQFNTWHLAIQSFASKGFSFQVKNNSVLPRDKYLYKSVSLQSMKNWTIIKKKKKKPIWTIPMIFRWFQTHAIEVGRSIQFANLTKYFWVPLNVFKSQNSFTN